MSATLSPSRIPITQPTLIRLLTLSPTLFGVLALLWQTQPLRLLRTIQTPSLPLSTTATSLRLPTSPALCSALRSLPLLLATLLLAPQRLARLALLAAFLPHLSTSLSMVTAAALLLQTRRRAPTLRFLHSTQSPSPMLQRARLLLTPCTPMVATLSSTLQAA